MIYLGTEIKKYKFNSGKSRWSMPSTHYVNNSIKMVKGLLKYEDSQLIKFRSAGKNPLTNGYFPELYQRNYLRP